MNQTTLTWTFSIEFRNVHHKSNCLLILQVKLSSTNTLNWISQWRIKNRMPLTLHYQLKSRMQLVMVSLKGDGCCGSWSLISMLNAGQPTTDFVALSRESLDTKESIQTTAIGRIEKGDSVKKTVYLCAEDLPGTRLVTLTVSYIWWDLHW